MNFLSNSLINQINLRYSDRLREFGDNPKTLGWSSKQQQSIRFDRYFQKLTNSVSSILDIGCGFGDFASFLSDKNYPLQDYYGIDINSSLLEVARRRKIPFDTKFLCLDILNDDDIGKQVDLPVDLCMSCGIFNLNFLGSTSKMHDFLFSMITKMCSLSHHFVIVDFIPSVRRDLYPAESYIASYSVNSVVNYLQDNNYAYCLDLLQDPNPMTEALLIIDLS